MEEPSFLAAHMAVSLLFPFSQHCCCSNSCLGLFKSGATGEWPPLSYAWMAAPKPGNQGALLCSIEPGRKAFFSDTGCFPTKPVSCSKEQWLTRFIICAQNMSGHRPSKSKHGLEKCCTAPLTFPSLRLPLLPKEKHTAIKTGSQEALEINQVVKQDSVSLSKVHCSWPVFFCVFSHYSSNSPLQGWRWLLPAQLGRLC